MSRLGLSPLLLLSLVLRSLLLVGLCALPPLATSVPTSASAPSAPAADPSTGGPGTLTEPVAGPPARPAAEPVAGGMTARGESGPGRSRAERYPEAATHGRAAQARPQDSTITTSVGEMTPAATINAVCSGCPYWVSPTWKSQHPVVSPTALEGPGMVYDAARKQNVLFGGWNNGPHAGTWTFNGTSWTQKKPTTSPSARFAPQMAYDAARGNVVLFGGYDAAGNALGDTWTWDGSTWTQRSPSASPPARYAGVADYHAPSSRTIVFGGYSDNGVLGDTWAWNGTSWAKLTPSASPGARSDAGMAYDASSQQLVLYGGADGANNYSAETWTFNGTTWTLIGTQGPGGLYGPSLAYNPALRRVVMFGGYSDSAGDNQNLSYVYSGGAWGMLGAPTTPAARYHAAMAQNPAIGQLVLTGGTDSTSYFNSTHTFDWPKAGFQAGYKHEKQQLTDRLSLANNVAGGNATVVANDLSLPGAGIGLSLTRHYNTQQTLLDYDKGYGWFFDTGQDLWIANQPDGSKLLSGYAGSSYGGAYFRRNADGTFVTPPGVNAVLRQAGGTYTVTYHKDGRVQTFRDTDGVLLSDLDRNGNGLRFTYSGATLTKITNNEGRSVTFTYSGGRITKIADNTGRAVTYTYTSGYLTGVTDAGGKTTGYSYDTAAGRLTSITDALGNVTKLAINDLNELASITRVTDTTKGTGPTTTYTYKPRASGDPGGAVLRTLSVAPNQQGTSTGTTYATNHAGQALAVFDPLGRKRSTTYTSNADVATAVDAMGTSTTAGNTTTFGHDTDFRATKTTAPTGAFSTLTYKEAAGTVTNRAAHYQPSGSTDAEGSTSSYTYDGPGNLKTSSTTTPTGAVTSTYTYNGPPGTAPTCGGKPGQMCTVTDGRGKVTSYSYNTLGELTNVNNPAPLGDTSTTYDALGRVAAATDGKGQVTRYSYDNLDRTTQVLFAGATSCTSTVRSAGNCLTYTYNAVGNQLTQVDQTGTVSYGYDKLGRETSRSLPSTGTTTLTYDANGNTLTATDGSGTITYRYDAANQLLTLAEPGASCPATAPTTGTTAGCTRFGYNANGLRTTTSYPTGSTATVMTVAPDNSGRVKQITAKTGTAVRSDFSYTYSRDVNGVATDGGLVRTRTENPGTTAALTTTYGYDTLSRLISAAETNTSGGTTASWSYGYDAAGNRTSASLSGTPGAAQTTFGYNDANQLISRNGSTSGFSYDANGNETAAVGATTRTVGAWNAKGQLTSTTVGGTARPFTYTGIGNGTRLSAAGTTYRNTALGVTAQTASGATTSFVRDSDGTLIAMRVGTASYYYTFDGLGSVTGLVNSSGTKVNNYRYDPYGVARGTQQASGVDNPYRYIGGQFDATTGLIKLGVRYYDPILGRFTQIDPSGISAHYSYAANSPVTFVDATGLYVSVPADYVYDPDLGALNDYCTFVPDQYAAIGDNADFRGPCARHDQCYGGSTSEYTCDERFLANLSENCASAYGSLDPRRYDCYKVAGAYFSGVVLGR